MRVTHWDTASSLHGPSMDRAQDMAESARTGFVWASQARSEALSVRRTRQSSPNGPSQRHPNDNDKKDSTASTGALGKRIFLAGIPIDALTEREVVDRIIADWRRGRGGWVVTPNLDHLRILRSRPELKETIAEAATLMIADGMPLVWASILQGTPLPERVAGSELILSLTAAAAQAGASIFLLGGNLGAGERAATLMVASNPGLKIAGILAPPMGFEKNPELIAAIARQVVAANPDLVYSCFGFPKQEYVIQQLTQYLPRTWFLGLGGSLSMVSGEFKRAPLWMRRSGLEWLCRLVQEPHRLFKRYILQDAPFALLLLSSSALHRWSWRQAARTSLNKAHPRAVPRVVPVVNGDDRKQSTDEGDRDRILNHYTSIGLFRLWRQFRAGFNRFAWFALLGWGKGLKRTIDIVGALILLIMLSPVMLLFAILVKFTSPGPVLFTQTRVGDGGRLFRMYKFRSMRRDAEERMKELLTNNEVTGGITFKIKNDPRRTRIGSFMRTWSIDELPQLWNVLVGDMSLVGPRPPIPSEVQQYTLIQRRRLDAVPGLTCIWQVSGRCEIPFDKQVELDVEYIDSQSVTLDLKLIAQTVSAVLQRRGAY